MAESSTSPNMPNEREDANVFTTSQWTQLPQAIIAQIFKYLDPVERRRASLTCKQWRECYFNPILWRDVQLCFNGACWLEYNETSCKGAEVVLERCGAYIRHVHIVPYTMSLLKDYIRLNELFVPKIVMTSSTMTLVKSTEQVHSNVTRLLEIVSTHCKNLTTVEVKIPESSIHADEIHMDYSEFRNLFPTNSTLVRLPLSIECERRIWEQIAVVLDKSPALQQLKLGYIVDIIGNADRLHHVARTCGNTLQALHCATFHVDQDEEVEELSKIDMDSFKLLSQITDLRLNIKYVTDELLSTLSSKHRCPMKMMVILITGPEERNVHCIPDGMSNKAWQALVSHSPDLTVGIVCHCAFTYGLVQNITLVEVLCMAAIPLRWLKIVSIYFIEDEIFRLLQSNFKWDLHHLELIHVAIDPDDILSISQEDQEPSSIVMTMQRCTALLGMIIAGFKIKSTDVLSIARESLTRAQCAPIAHGLEVFRVHGSSIVYVEPMETEEKLVNEVRRCFGYDWLPLDDMEASLTLWEIMDRPVVPANKYGTGPVS